MTLIESIQVWEIRNEGKKWFDDFVLDSRIGRDYLYNMLLIEYRDMKTMYADSVLFHQSVGLFFVKNSDRIKRLLDTLELKYDPIENYRTRVDVNQKDAGTKDFTQGDTDSNTTTHDDTTTTTESSNREDKHHVSAYNNPAGNDIEQNRDTSTETVSRDVHDTGTKNSNGTYNSKQNTGTTDTMDRWEEKHGITSSSYEELIDKERRTVQFNITDWILREFCKDLLVGLW